MPMLPNHGSSSQELAGSVGSSCPWYSPRTGTGFLNCVSVGGGGVSAAEYVQCGGTLNPV